MLNSLAQLVLKLASPGVPDFYQGSELWNLDLVDPDNRREVDFIWRQRLLKGLQPLIAAVEAGGVGGAEVRDLLDHWEDGRIKLLVTSVGLRFRRRHPEVALDGAYLPLRPEGPAADHLVACARQHTAGTLVAVVPRLVTSLMPEADALPLGGTWASTRLLLPEALPATCYRHLLTGESIEPARDGDRHVLALEDVLQTAPVALLWAPRSAG
jgi:(1->4)-alpha-D-glucan 1-alpha-D-glucosylmutase